MSKVGAFFRRFAQSLRPSQFFSCLKSRGKNGSASFLQSFSKKVRALCRMIKIEHSVFALPFAYIGAFLAAQGLPPLVPFLWLTLAMVAVRSYAMLFNRLVDLPFDSKNPRTRGRALVTGEVTRLQAWIGVLLCAALFVGACAMLNSLCLALSPVALFISSVYSLCKRFTWSCHFVLGAVLGLAPIAGSIAITPQITVVPVLFALGVLFWAAGFDILYSCQDAAFDQKQGLHSVPASLGVSAALQVSSSSHVNASVFFALAGWVAELSWVYFAVWGLVSLILCVEHCIISAEKMQHINLAFFTLNGIISIVLFFGVLGGMWY